MGSSKTSAGHRSKSTTSHQAQKPLTFQSLIQQFYNQIHHNLSATERPKCSWTKEQLSDANFLKVPASVWKNIHDPTRTEWIDAAEDTLTSALADSAVYPVPVMGLTRVYKWFWDKSIQTTTVNDTYRYRVMDQATNITVLPEDDEYDPEDDENKIKILLVGLPFKDHHIMLLRRICPDSKMSAIHTDDEWRQHLAPSVRQGFRQVKRSTAYGWPLTVNRKRKSRGRKRGLKARPSTVPPSSAELSDVDSFSD